MDLNANLSQNTITEPSRFMLDQISGHPGLYGLSLRPYNLYGHPYKLTHKIRPNNDLPCMLPFILYFPPILQISEFEMFEMFEMFPNNSYLKLFRKTLSAPISFLLKQKYDLSFLICIKFHIIYVSSLSQ